MAFPDPDTVMILTQAGAVGIALAIVAGVYLIIRRSIEVVNEFVSNHVVHLTEAIDNNTKTVTLALEENSVVLNRLDETISALNRRM